MDHSIKLDFSPITAFSSELGAAFGFATPREIWALRVLAWSLPESPVIVNIGSGAGTSGLAFAESRSDAHIYTVDISAGGPLGGLENERNAFADKPHLKIPTQILGDSKKVGVQWGKQPNLPIDLLFIDGSHLYDDCLGDVIAWRGHIKPGGLIVLHDYERDVWPDVRRVVEESGALADFERFLRIDTLWVGRKG